MAPVVRLGSIPDKRKKLLDQVRDVIRRKHFSIRTEQAYTDWIRRFILYHEKRHPREMAEGKWSIFSRIWRGIRSTRQLKNRAKCSAGCAGHCLCRNSQPSSTQARRRGRRGVVV
jgi:integrase-like protein